MDTFTTSEGVRIAYRLAGDGPPLLLVSGLNGRAAFWDQVVARLAQRWRVLSFDQRGCGESSDTDATVSVERLAADASELADHLFAERPRTVLGHSTGGAIAQVLGARHPGRVDRLVLSGSWLVADGYMHALFALRRALLRRAPDLDAALTDLLRFAPDAHPRAPSLPQGPTEIAVTERRIAALLAFDGRGYAAAIRMPALVMGAQDDRIVPRHLQAELGAALVGSDRVELTRGGHFFPRTEPGAFVHRVAAWLEDRRS